MIGELLNFLCIMISISRSHNMNLKMDNMQQLFIYLNCKRKNHTEESKKHGCETFINGKISTLHLHTSMLQLYLICPNS